MTAGLSFSPSFSLGDTAPESGKPFKWFSRVGDNEDPKLKLGENEKGRLQPAREKQTVKDVKIMNSARDNPGNTNKQDQTLKALGLCGINPVRVERLGPISPRVEATLGWN